MLAITASPVNCPHRLFTKIFQGRLHVADEQATDPGEGGPGAVPARGSMRGRRPSGPRAVGVGANRSLVLVAILVSGTDRDAATGEMAAMGRRELRRPPVFGNVGRSLHGSTSPPPLGNGDSETL